VACRLEKLVRDKMQAQDFSQAFATAAEVAETLQGDCTEHAVLLAALCRAREIPNHNEHSPNDNALYAFKAGDFWILHMGDLGYKLTPEQLAPFVGHCDMFLVITGEMNTPTHEELDPMIDFLSPKWVVPMHYNLPPLSFGMSRIEEFLDHRSGDPVVFPRHHTVTLPAPELKPGRPSIIVPEPSGYTVTK